MWHQLQKTEHHTMAAALVCAALAATLSLTPDRSQFFTIYDSFTLSCPSDSGGWTVMRNTTKRRFQPCQSPWGTPRGSSCVVDDPFGSDTGHYWCQNETHCSPAVHITITEKFVILESPLRPVTEGDEVTLKCSYKEKNDRNATSDFPAKFFKDGAFIGDYSVGTMVISSVSKSHEGLYKCEHPSEEQSLESNLLVKDRPLPEATPPPPHCPMRITLPQLLCFVLLFILYTILLVLAVCVYLKWARARAEAKLESERLTLREISPR